MCCDHSFILRNPKDSAFIPEKLGQLFLSHAPRGKGSPRIKD